MSPLVTRPSLPEPGTVAASMPLSAESFRTDGVAGFLEPSADGGFRHGLAERRNTNFSHGIFPLCVMARLVPAIHALTQFSKNKTWMPGTSGARAALRLLPGHDDVNKS